MRRRRVDDLSRIVETIKEVGPRNFSLIANLTHIPESTVRYKVKNQLLKRGVMINASIDYSKLALARCWLTLNFEEEYQGAAPNLLRHLSEIGYLEWFAKIIPWNTFASITAVPIRWIGEYENFLRGMVSRGILREYQMNRLSWWRILSIRPEFYNFKTGEWTVNWDEVAKVETKVEEVLSKPLEKPLADKTDLLIIKELQIDSTRPLKKIADKLGEDFFRLWYHYTNHVMKRALVRKYNIHWYPKEAEASGRVLRPVFLFRNLSRDELLMAENIMHKIPFVWSDSYSEEENLYLVYTTLPASHYFDTISYIGRRIPFTHKMESLLLDPTCMEAFTICYKLFDRNWTFNAEETLIDVENLVIRVREEG